MQPSADISEILGTQLIFQLNDAYIFNRDEMCSAPNWRQSYFITSQAVLPDWQRVLNVLNHTRQAASSNW